MIPLRYPRVWWALGGLLVAGVAVGSLMPGRTLEGVSISDKLLHALAYFILTFWFSGMYPRQRHWLVALAIFAFGFALELGQAFTSSRSFDPADSVANATGILLGIVLAWFFLAGWCRRVEEFFSTRSAAS